MNQILKIVIVNAGSESSNGEYLFNLLSNRYLSDSGNYIEHTIDGWILIDLLKNEQTYAFNEDFSQAYLAGDGELPLPNIEVIN